MATFSQIKTQIANKLGESYLESQIGDVVNSVIRYYSRYHFWFNEESTTITLTASVAAVPSIPSNFLYEAEDSGLVILDGGSYYTLEKITNAEYDRLNSGGTGRPDVYRNRDGSLELYYLPDQAYTLYLLYIKKYSDLSTDGDTNDFTNYAERLLVNSVLEEIYRDNRKDIERSLVYRQIANDELSNILYESNRRRRTGQLNIEDISQGEVEFNYN